MATIKDVAKAAGVSVSTVSAALNGTAPVKESTCKRILEVCEDMGYRPNRLARGLKTKRSYTIGVIIPELTNPFFPEVVRAIEHRAKEYNYNTILCDTDDDPEIGLSDFHLLAEKQVDGIILIGGVVTRDVILSSKKLPIVVIEKEYHIPWVSTIMADLMGGAYKAVNHLIGIGCRRIAYITCIMEKNTIYRRFEGYKLALKDNQISFDSSLIKEESPDFQGGYKAMKSFEGNLPDAVFSYNDVMAMGALKACSEMGIRVPRDIAMVGFDDIDTVSFTSPPLSTVALPKQEMGSLATETLINSILNREKPRNVSLSTKLIIRESCK
ncbi:LacI family DNA-binding transcriptional regulator [candidate division WOR-3 bacterium]|nr:LacI family DNA-binding transcriptional regulator [candidate division WOR-3 bacterium]